MLFLLMSLAVTGCSAPQTHVSMAQWTWGRSLRLARNQAPEFEPTEKSESADETSDAETDVTVVEPDENKREPRRLFGFGGSQSKDQESSSRPSQWRNAPNSFQKNNVVDEEGQRAQAREYARAEELVEAGRLDDAEAILKPLAKKKQQSFFSKWSLTKIDTEVYQDHNRVREDSLFLLGEIYFKQERYKAAKDHYEALLKDYPSTRHLNVSTRRLFTVARTWLGMPEFATSNEVTPVNLEDPRATEVPKKEKPPHSAVLVPNLTDKTRPAFDTPGHALEALKSIWLYDPRGPLADDAIMLTASHYFRTGNYEESDRYFSMLREEYPNSPHLQTSFVIGSHVKLMSYQGAEYDAKQLEDARLLKESTLRLFPDVKEKQRLEQELGKIEDARAQRLWELVEFYQRKNKPKAIRIYAEELLRTFPNSSYAPRARDALAAAHAEDSEPRGRFSLPRISLWRGSEGESDANAEASSDGVSRVGDEGL